MLEVHLCVSYECTLEIEVFSSRIQWHLTKVRDIKICLELYLYLFFKVRTPPSPTGVIAFHAYKSKDSSGPLPIHHVLTFDVVSLNKGDGYNAFDGIFIVPVAGTYVFTWSFMSEPHGTVYTQLMKNADVIGTRYADSATASVWDFSTGVVVVDVAVGNHIYVRLGYESNGKVLSITESKTSFSGWLLD